MFVNQFNNDEQAYEDWCKKNPSGYVFNLFGGSDASYNKLHHVNCLHLWRDSDRGVRTAIPKICSDNFKALKHEVTKLRGSVENWTFCKMCFK